METPPLSVLCHTTTTTETICLHLFHNMGPSRGPSFSWLQLQPLRHVLLLLLMSFTQDGITWTGPTWAKLKDGEECKLSNILESTPTIYTLALEFHSCMTKHTYITPKIPFFIIQGHQEWQQNKQDGTNCNTKYPLLQEFGSQAFSLVHGRVTAAYQNILAFFSKQQHSRTMHGRKSCQRFTHPA